MKNFLINELTQGKEVVNQLQTHICPCSSTGELLITKLLSSFDKSLLMLNRVKLEAEQPQLSAPTAVKEKKRVIKEGHYDPNLIYKSKQRRIAPSSTEEVRVCSKWGLEEPQDDAYSWRKYGQKLIIGAQYPRRIVPSSTEEVRVCSKRGLEEPQDDAYSWRKYGQKLIIGAQYPRSYYRCIYRDDQQCLAMKQVQRSDEDSTIFRVTYLGRHTCIQASHHVIPQQSSPNTQNQEQMQKMSQEIFINFQTAGTRVNKTVELHKKVMTPDNHFVGSFSPATLSPTISEPDDFNSYGMNSFGAQSFGTSGSDLNAIVSAATFTSNSVPILDLDLEFPVDFNLDFLFDILGS